MAPLSHLGSQEESKIAVDEEEADMGMGMGMSVHLTVLFTKMLDQTVQWIQ